MESKNDLIYFLGPEGLQCYDGVRFDFVETVVIGQDDYWAELYDVYVRGDDEEADHNTG